MAASTPTAGQAMSDPRDTGRPVVAESQADVCRGFSGDLGTYTILFDAAEMAALQALTAYDSARVLRAALRAASYDSRWAPPHGSSEDADASCGGTFFLTPAELADVARAVESDGGTVPCFTAASRVAQLIATLD